MSQIDDLLERLVTGGNLTRREAESVVDRLMSDQLDQAQIGGLLIALRASGETAEEIAGFASSMRDHARSFDLKPEHRPLVDTCGTGGGSVETINISTLSAIVAAGTGTNVAKHGNRSVSSRCGSADLLEQLGVKLELTPEQVKSSIKETGIGFMYAPAFHRSMKHATGPRKSLGIRTIFNLLGPLTNPADADRQLVGVFSSEWVRPMAEALSTLGVDRALVVHGTEGMDEISPSQTTVFAEVENGRVKEGELVPSDFNLEPVDIDAIEGGGPRENMKTTLRLLEGEGPEPIEDVVSINTGAVIYLAGRVSELVEGARLARETIRGGAAKRKLNQLIEFTQSVDSS